MKYVRLYSTPDGESHFADVELDLQAAARPGLEARTLPSDGFIVNRIPSGAFLDWHPAPRRQFVIVTEGETEIQASDGEVRHFLPGSFMLAEDVAGKGHTLRIVSAVDVYESFVPVGDWQP